MLFAPFGILTWSWLPKLAESFRMGCKELSCSVPASCAHQPTDTGEHLCWHPHAPDVSRTLTVPTGCRATDTWDEPASCEAIPAAMAQTLLGKSGSHRTQACKALSQKEAAQELSPGFVRAGEILCALRWDRSSHADLLWGFCRRCLQRH